MTARHRAHEHWQGQATGHGLPGAKRFIPGLSAGWVVGHCVLCRIPITNDDLGAVAYVDGEFRCARVHTP